MFCNRTFFLQSCGKAVPALSGVDSFRSIFTAFSTTSAKMAAKDPHSIYQFTVKGINDEPISLEKYRGKVVLIVNVASQCGFTNSNYTQLKEILDKYRDKGFEVAAFPCNQFANQEPGCPIDIQESVKSKFQFEPDLYAKIDVNGQKQDPLYAFLKKEKGGTLIDAIKWNFTKFLVDRKGHVVQRYGPNTEPKTFVKDIEKLLEQQP